MSSLAKASEQFRQSDVAVWGIAALACAGVAMIGSNVSLMLPQGALVALHQPRLGGVSIESLRVQVSDLSNETNRLKRENESLVARFALQEQSGSDVTRRVGALEENIPLQAAPFPVPVAIDRSSLTASIGTGDAQYFDADGGTVSVKHSPMPQALAPEAAEQPLPATLSMTPPNTAAYGMIIGTPVASESAAAFWSDLTIKLGPLLFGLEPRLTDATGSDDKRIVVGPITLLSEASALCERFERVSISCTPAPYDGTSLTALQQ